MDPIPCSFSQTGPLKQAALLIKSTGRHHKIIPISLVGNCENRRKLSLEDRVWTLESVHVCTSQLCDLEKSTQPL